MSDEQDNMFRIKFRDLEYVVMTTKMQRDGFMEGGEFLARVGTGQMIANDQLYAILLKMTILHEREEFTIRR